MENGNERAREKNFQNNFLHLSFSKSSLLFTIFSPSLSLAHEHFFHLIFDVFQGFSKFPSTDYDLKNNKINFFFTLSFSKWNHRKNTQNFQAHRGPISTKKSWRRKRRKKLCVITLDTHAQLKIIVSICFQLLSVKLSSTQKNRIFAVQLKQKRNT